MTRTAISPRLAIRTLLNNRFPDTRIWLPQMTQESEVPGPVGTRFSSIAHVLATGSTNADLLAVAASGGPEGAVRVTDHQTAGRGRQARAWHDEPGDSLLISVLLRPQPTVVAVVPFIIGLAAVDTVDATLAELAPARADHRAALKWPNDVLVPALGERKLAGILAEATTAAGEGHSGLAVVVGMGMNLRWSSPPPSEIAARAATLTEIVGLEVERWSVAEQLLVCLERWLQLAETDGPLAVLRHYRRQCLTIGRQVRMQTPNQLLEGEAIAVADDGGLVVAGPQGPVTVFAGDAHHV